MQIGDLVFYRHEGRTTNMIGVITAISTNLANDGGSFYFVRFPNDDGFESWYHPTRLEALCK